MVSRVTTVAFQGIEAVPVDVQVHVGPGAVAFNVVGLPDKAVAESRERVRAALSASGLAVACQTRHRQSGTSGPAQGRLSLRPADRTRHHGCHWRHSGRISGWICTVLGELGLDGTLAPVAGVLPAAMGATALGKGLICPGSQRQRSRLGRCGDGHSRSRAR